MISDTTLFAGAEWNWTDSFTDYPASEFDCVLYLKLGTNNTITLTPTKDGDDFIFTKPSAFTESLPNGLYNYQYKFTNLDDDKIYVVPGQVQINSLLSSCEDPRSEDQIVLDALIAARPKVAKRDYASVTINGKATTFKTLTEIDQAIVRYKKKLGLITTQRILSSFE
ncbi:MAG: hypothetical protein FIA82_08250 [Melioribacter sp.]|nr:hypothetical protein [Melioribacter sp.]